MKRLAQGALLALLLGCGRVTSSAPPGAAAGGGAAAFASMGSGGRAGSNEAAGGGTAGNGGAAGQLLTSGSGGGPLGACSPSLPECGGGSECCPSVPATAQLTLLTASEYDATVRDLLGVSALTSMGGLPPSSLLPDAIGEPIALAAWDGFQAASEAVAAQVRAGGMLLNRFVTCAASDAGCFHDTIVNFGRRAFRRPLTEAEIARFEKIVADGATITATGSPEEIAEVLLIAFLVSPSFLQRTELVQDSDPRCAQPLSSYEIAARLSYLLWGSTPDRALDEAADRDQLRTKAQILAQAERMLADPKARDPIAAFHRFYLGMDSAGSWWESANGKDPMRFPAYDEATARAMREELDRFFVGVTFGGGRFRDLFLSPLGFVNADTAPIYALDPRDFGDELEEVTLDPAERPGFLTRLGFLSAFAGADRNVPTRRGAFIGVHLLDLGVGAPDPANVTTPLPTDPALDTNRKRAEAQTSAQACKGCHQFIDPFGFVLEAYDAIGAHQIHEADTGAPIDTRTKVAVGPDEWVEVADAAELMQQLASSRRAERHYAEAWVSFAFRRAPNAQDACIVDDLAGRLANGDTILNMMAALTQTESFRLRTRATQ